MFRGGVGQEGTAEGHVWLHEPRVMVTNPFAEDPDNECERLRNAVETLRGCSLDGMLEDAGQLDKGGNHRDVLEGHTGCSPSRAPG